MTPHRPVLYPSKGVSSGVDFYRYECECGQWRGLDVTDQGQALVAYEQHVERETEKGRAA